MNANDLAMRDLALAALMGALPGQDNFGADPIDQAYCGADFGVSAFDVSRNIGSDFGASFGGPQFMLSAQQTPATIAANAAAFAPPPAALQNAHPALVQAWAQQQVQTAHTNAHEGLLNPNKNSTTKVERYSFSMNQVLTLGTAVAISMTLQPNATIRPQRVLANAPAPNFVLLQSLQVANVNVFIGATEDAYNYTAGAMGVMLDLPTLEPAYRATATGNYTGFVPPGFAIPFSYTFVLTFQGPAAIAGSAGN